MPWWDPSKIYGYFVHTPVTCIVVGPDDCAQVGLTDERTNDNELNNQGTQQMQRRAATDDC